MTEAVKRFRRRFFELFDKQFLGIQVMVHRSFRNIILLLDDLGNVGMQKTILYFFLVLGDFIDFGNNRRSCDENRFPTVGILKRFESSDIQADCFYFPDPLNLYQFVERPFVYPCQSIMKAVFVEKLS